MFMQEPPPTPYDLRFRLLDTAVRVSPWFWIAPAMLSLDQLKDNGAAGLLYVAIWLGCLFVSVLVHEFGHILMGRYFGNDGHIVLYAFGGLAIGSYPMSDRGQRILVSFAGPAAGFLLFGLTAGVVWLYDTDMVVNLLRACFWRPWYRGDWPDWAERVVLALFQINLFWGLVNLLPVWPLDGGQISAELFQKQDPDQGLRRALMLSIGTAAVFAFLSAVGALRKESIIPYLPPGSLFQVIFFAYLAFMSWQALQATNAGGGRYRFEDESYERAPWERDADWWKR